jgi:hypothetical protein
VPTVVLAVLTPAVLFLTRSNQQTGDGLLYATSIKTGVDLFHPHHLLYAPVVRAIFLTLRPLGVPGWDAIAAAQLHGIAWATVAVVFTFRIARRITGWTSLAVAGALALLFAQGFWMVSTHANSYVPALGCLSAALYLLVRRDPGTPSRGDLASASVLWGLSILYHQVNVLLFLPVVLFLRTSTRDSRRRLLAPALLPAAGLAVVAYVAVALMGRSGAALERLRLPLDYAFHPNPDWGTVHHLSLSGLDALISGQAWALLALHRAFGVLVVTVITVLCVAVLGWHLRQARLGADHAPLRLLLGSWVVAYLGFYLWWLPTHKPLYVLTSLPIVLLVLIAFDDQAASSGYFGIGRRASAALAWVAVAVMAAFNLSAVILPLHVARGAAYDEARSLNEQVDPGCYVLTSYEVAQSLRYYFDRPRSAHARFPLLCILQDLPVPEEFDIRDTECVVVQAAYLRPDGDFLGFDAYAHPARFERWLSWLLDVTPGGDRPTHREIGSIDVPDGKGYFTLGTARETHDAWYGVLGELDRAAPWHDRALEQWWNDTRDGEEGSGAAH